MLMCGETMMRKELFEKHFKADMLKLITDPVSNVRLALAKVINTMFLTKSMV